MSRAWRFIIGLIAFLPTAAFDATVVLEGSTLLISGQLSEDDERSIIDAFLTRTVRTVRFEDCLGGTYSPQETLERFIGTNGTATEAKGLVASACAFAFMAGSSRRMVPSDRTDTQLAFHAPINPLTGEVAKSAEWMRRQLMERSGGRIKPAVAALMVPSDNSRSWFHVFLRSGQYQGHAIHVIYCPGNVPEHPGCEGFYDADALSLGLVTELAGDRGSQPPTDR